LKLLNLVLGLQADGHQANREKERPGAAINAHPDGMTVTYIHGDSQSVDSSA